MNPVTFAAQAMWATRKERLVLSVMAALALLVAWATVGPAERLAEQCAADGVTCNAVLPIIPLLSLLVAAVASSAAILPWGFGHARTVKEAEHD